MIRTILPLKFAGENVSPFMSPWLLDRARSLRITIHAPDGTALDPDESFALSTIRDLAEHPEIESSDTAPGADQHLRVEEDSEGDCEAVTNTPHGFSRTVMSSLASHKNIARELGVQDRLTDVLPDILIAGAHAARRADLLITTSQVLIENCEHRWLKELNICSPAAGCKVLGLYLRHRGDYSLRRSYSITRFGFYLELAAARLPSCAELVKSCGQLATFLKEPSLGRLGEAVLSRADWALQARDAIGCQFHQPANWGTLSQALYHFNYLTLLLVGILDAQARIAHRLYLGGTSTHKRPSLRNEEFLTAVFNAGGTELSSLLRRHDFATFVTLLKRLRNTIHAGVPEQRMHGGSGHRTTGQIQLDPDDALDILSAAEAAGGHVKWGLKNARGIVDCEPYMYALSLLDLAFEWADKIASAIDCCRFLPTRGGSPGSAKAQPVDPLRLDTPRLVLALG